MKKLLIIPFLIFTIFAHGQIKYGLYGGFNFPSVTSDLTNVRDLPIDKGGVTFMLGLHGSYEIFKDIELESGLNYTSKGYTIETFDSWDISYDNYNTINTLSVPVTVMYYVVGKDDYGNRWEDFRLGIGAGLYAAYILNGKITNEDNNSTTATFSNTNRDDFGGRLMLKTLFGHFEGFVIAEFGLRNTVKDGTAVIKQNSFLMGIGYQF